MRQLNVSRQSRKGKHLNWEERIQIETLQRQGLSSKEIGNLVQTAVDLNANGQLDLTADRISENETSYQQISGDYWKTTLSRIYAEENSSSVLTTAVKRVRLTGLGTQSSIGNLKSEIVSIDRFSNETIQKGYIDRNSKTVTTVTDVPDSTNDVVRVRVNNMLQSVQSAQSVETQYSYDALTRRIGAFQVSGFTSQVLRTVGSTIHYNALGQIDWQEDAASNRTSYAYDSDTARKTAVTNALGESTLYTYNTRGQVAVVGGSSQYPVEYGYNDLGRMTDLYTLRGATNGWDRTQWFFDEATGLVTNKLDDTGNGPTYTYTPDGKFATRIWARSVGGQPLITTYSYDLIGSLTNTVYSDSTPSVFIAYNRLGQKTQVIDASGTNTFAYSALLQLTNETQLATFDLSRTYDSMSRSTGYSFSGGTSSTSSVSYDYDALGRFASVSSSVDSVSSVVNYSRLPGSSLISGYTNSHGLAVSYDFENNRNAKTGVLNEFGTTLVSQFDYTYDELMRRTQRTDVRDQESEVSTNDFGYNARSELTSALMGTNDFDYAYDSIGNRTSATNNNQPTTYSANALNQYTQITDNSVTNNYTYDADGNLLSDGVNTYSWNGENRLIEVEPIQMEVGCHYLYMTYDSRGRRIRKRVYAYLSAGWELRDQDFVYDGWNAISETVTYHVGSNPLSKQNHTNHYVYGLDLSQSRQGAGGIGGLLSVTVAGGGDPGSFFPSFDANGNITEYVSTNGTVVAHYEYNPYGGLISSSGSMADDFAFRFSTKYFDVETGLSYYGYRYYSPESGRWLNRDPIGERGGVNLYGFCANNSIDRVDSLGLYELDQNHVPDIGEVVDKMKEIYDTLSNPNAWSLAWNAWNLGGTLGDPEMTTYSCPLDSEDDVFSSPCIKIGVSCVYYCEDFSYTTASYPGPNATCPASDSVTRLYYPVY